MCVVRCLRIRSPNTTCEDLLGGDRGESPIILLVVVLSSVLVRNNNSRYKFDDHTTTSSARTIRTPVMIFSCPSSILESLVDFLPGGVVYA